MKDKNNKIHIDLTKINFTKLWSSKIKFTNADPNRLYNGDDQRNLHATVLSLARRSSYDARFDSTTKRKQSEWRNQEVYFVYMKKKKEVYFVNIIWWGAWKKTMHSRSIYTIHLSNFYKNFKILQETELTLSWSWHKRDMGNFLLGSLKMQQALIWKRKGYQYNRSLWIKVSKVIGK